MQDEPTPTELVKAVADFLRTEITPVIKGHNAFKLRVGINALDLVTRQLALEGPGDAAPDADHQGLQDRGAWRARLLARLLDAADAQEVSPRRLQVGLRTEAIAMADARAGERVRLQNRNSLKVFEGLVDSDGRVRVSP